MRKATRARNAPPAVLVAIIGALLVGFTWHREYSDLLSDSAIYLLQASIFSPSQSVPAAVFTNVMEEYHLPPGLGLALAVVGAGAPHPTLSHVVNALFLTLGVAAYLGWLRSRGLTSAASAASAVVFCLLPATLFFSNIILSEHLYLALSLWSLLLLGRADNPRAVYVAAGVVGCAILTRSIGVALLPALAIVALRTERRTVVRALALALGPALAWFAYRSQYSAYGYLDSFLTSDTGDPFGYLIWRVGVNARHLWLAWAGSFHPDVSPFAALLAAGLAILALVEGARRLRRLGPDAVYLTLYLCIILVWPHASHMRRFLFPVLPLLLGYSAMLLQGAAARSESRWVTGVAAVAVPAAVALAALPTDLRVAARFISPPPEEIGSFDRSNQWLFAPVRDKALSDVRFLNRLYRAIAASRTIPETECVWSIDAQRHMLLSMRSSYEAPLPGLNDAELQDRMRQCGYAMAMNVTPLPNPRGYPPMYPESRLGSGWTPLRTEAIDGLVVARLYQFSGDR